MKPCLNIESFFEKIKNLGGEMGMAQEALCTEIRHDLDSTYKHMKVQLGTLNNQLHEFKEGVYKIDVHNRIKPLLHGYEGAGRAADDLER